MYKNEKVESIIKNFRPRFGNQDDIDLVHAIIAYNELKVKLDIKLDSDKLYRIGLLEVLIKTLDEKIQSVKPVHNS